MDPPGKFMSVRGTDGPSWKIHVCSGNRGTLLENSCLFGEQMDPPGKFVSVRGTDGPSWKIRVCSGNRWTLLENSCLFGEQMDPPGKFLSVRGTDGPSWKIIKRLLLEKKNSYFGKLARWLLLLTSFKEKKREA